jgi:cytochrome oxidase Cu insertion factor (SCO1/SenC/PrrC family)
MNHGVRWAGTFVVAVSTILLGVGSIASPRPAAAEPKVGDRAPDFTLPATTGDKIRLSQFRGKKMVLLEFYGADFNPV